MGGFWEGMNIVFNGQERKRLVRAPLPRGNEVKE